MRKPSSKYAIALTAALGLFMAVLDNTIVNVALTPIATGLKADLSSIQWVITGYFLAQAAVIPISGYFSLRFGIKRLFILCLAFFTLGSLLCGLAQSETMLIGFRIIQGLGGGALFPLANAIALQAFPPRERAAASAVVGIPVLLAPAFGPTIGGLLTVNFGWEYIFFINVPVGFVAIFLAIRVFPADNLVAQSKKAFDYIGLSLSILGVLAVVYAFALVSESDSSTITAANPRGDIHGWGYPPVWILLIAGLALVAIFAIYEIYISKDPVLDLRLFKSYDFTVASIISWLSAIVVFGSLFMLPIFLEQVRVPHLSALDAGLALMPQGLAAAVAVGLGGKMYNRFGPRVLVMTGAVLLVFSSFMLTSLKPESDGLFLMPWLIIRGLGFGMTAIPVQTLALMSLTGPALPKASSLFNVTRQIFSSIGIAVLASLFVQQSAQHGTDIGSQIAAGTLPRPTTADAQALIVAQAGTSGMNDVFMFVTIGTVILLLVAVILPKKPHRAEGLSKEIESHAEQPAMIME
ncbi:MAG: multidrug efflux MFS transporter [Chloroflexi bacterium]|uniref:Multidrug efflux MFS transporter n=1 Tax=Candidatus Chlorohelix allophototropha TaxID=3003348 RepID=A0A8T7M1P7_9CHLR|nr:multidrug efflux MFS transporter [Chloroflexota bacterium]WJW67521.1 multidrug efflux MFS transporter [Chloroflexota bacterium L227-S17]